MLFLSFHLDSPNFENTERLNSPKPDSDAVDPNEKTTQLVRKSSASPLSRGQPHQPSSSSSDAYSARDASPFQKATPEELEHATSQQIARERNPSLNGLPSQPTGVDDKPRYIPQEDDNSESSTERLAKLVGSNTSSGKEVARLEHERNADLERQLSETLAERDQQISQLTNQLMEKSTLLEMAEANAAEAKKRAGLEQRKLQAKLDELMLSRDQALEQAQSALQKANERSQRELAEVRAKLEARESELAAVRSRITDAEESWAKSEAAEAGTSRARAGSPAAAGPINMDMDRVMWRLMERLRSVEAEVASLRGNEKSIEEMECRNEG